MDIEREPPESRARLGWWLFALVLAAAVAFVAYRFVGMLVPGVFGYIGEGDDRLRRVVARSRDRSVVTPLSA